MTVRVTSGIDGVQQPQRARVATVAARIVVLLLVLNVLVDVGLRLAGLVESTNGALPFGDMFADYFRFVVSYPGGARIGSDFPWLAERLHAYHGMNAASGIEGLRTGALTHFNAPPINTLFGLANVWAMRWIEPGVLYGSLCLALLGYWSAIVVRYAPTRAEWPAWGILGLLSYPTLMVVVRGNVYAGVAGLLIVHALLLARRGGAPRLSAILLAVAVGIRPNAIVFAVPLVMLQADRWSVVRTFGLAVPTISGGAMLAAHLIYPDYRVATFLAGLRSYYLNYVVHAWGIPFGSSMFGALTLIFGAHPAFERLALLPAAAIGLSAIILHFHGRIRTAPYLFLIAAAYCLGSTIIADYHLFVFALPILVLATERDAPWTRSDRVAAIASCLMLAPKNYLYHGDVSIQPVLNPLILFVASGAIVALSLGIMPQRRRLEYASSTM